MSLTRLPQLVVHQVNRLSVLFGCAPQCLHLRTKRMYRDLVETKPIYCLLWPDHLSFVDRNPLLVSAPPLQIYPSRTPTTLWFFGQCTRARALVWTARDVMDARRSSGMSPFFRNPAQRNRMVHRTAPSLHQNRGTTPELHD